MCAHGYSSVLKEGERTNYVLMGAVLFCRKVRETDICSWVQSCFEGK